MAIETVGVFVWNPSGRFRVTSKVLGVEEWFRIFNVTGIGLAWGDL